MNYAGSSPMADRLLADIDLEAFDHDQAIVQTKGY
jgi:hypothetical protein